MNVSVCFIITFGFSIAPFQHLVDKVSLNQMVGSSNPLWRTNNVSGRTNRAELIQNQSRNKIWLIFLLPKNNIKLI